MRTYKRGRTWWYDFSLHGQRHRGPGGPRETDAQVKGAQKLAELSVESGGWSTSKQRASSITLGTAVEMWEEVQRAERARSDETLRVDVGHLKRFVTWAGEKTLLRNVRQEHLQRWADLRTRVHVRSPSTVARDVSSISSMFKWATLHFMPELDTLNAAVVSLHGDPGVADRRCSVRLSPETTRKATGNGQRNYRLCFRAIAGGESQPRGGIGRAVAVMVDNVTFDTLQSG